MSLDRQQLAWKLLQQAYQAQMHGDYDQAIELYTKSLEIFPTAEARTFLGWTYHLQGKVDEAIAEYQRILKLNPNYPLLRYHLAEAFARKGLRDQARAEYEQFLQVWKDADADIPEVVNAKKVLSES